MSNLTVLTFETETGAADALKDLRQVQRAGRLSFADTAVVSKSADGKVHVKNELDTGVEVGAVAGGVLGGLVMFMFPIAGIAVGAAAGALAGKLVDMGVDKKFVQEVGESLQPGGSALFALTKDGDPNAALAALRGHKGKVLQTTLSTDQEEQLKAAIGDKS